MWDELGKGKGNGEDLEKGKWVRMEWQKERRREKTRRRTGKGQGLVGGRKGDRDGLGKAAVLGKEIEE